MFKNQVPKKKIHLLLLLVHINSNLKIRDRDRNGFFGNERARVILNRNLTKYQQNYSSTLFVVIRVIEPTLLIANWEVNYIPIVSRNRRVGPNNSNDFVFGPVVISK